MPTTRLGSGVAIAASYDACCCEDRGGTHEGVPDSEASAEA
ncbi:hypothetical protein [Actinomyces howellii]|nr:hypothetical protein [Actinomyces howellii]